VWDKRHLAFGAPPRPGVYLFYDRNDQLLYVGRARDLRARLRSYFRSERQRPAVEAAVAAVERIEWRVLGSELEASLEELRLIRELRPPANARVARPERYVWLRRRGEAVVASQRPSDNLSLGPLRSRRRAQLAARALLPDELERPALALPRLRRRIVELADQRRFEDAARLRDRMQALEQVCRELERLRQLRSVERCIVAPAAEAGHARAFFVSGGRIAAERTLPPGGGAYLEIEAGLAAARRIGEPGDLDELHLIGTFLRKPTPELTIVPLDRDAILRAAARSAAARAPARAAAARTPAPAPAAGSSLF
jgi:DNA polymerase-3 subunit epsilon